jgi:tRNA G37 N-methylase Trm5
MGNSTVKGVRKGTELIGRWELEVKSEFGTGKQVLTVYPDMSGLYGPTPVEKIRVDGDTVSFTVSTEFGEQRMEWDFAGRLEGGVLSGTMSGERGSFELSGRKIIVANPEGMVGTTEQEEEFGEPDVIFVPTPQKVVDRMLEMAKVTGDDVLYDLGCGDGRIVVTAAKRYGCRAYGYDIDPERIRESRENVRSNNVGDLVTIERKDIFTLDLSEADVVTLYLLPSLNIRLIPQLEKLRPGCRIVSHDFDMKGVRPDEVVEIEDSDDDYGDHTVYLWTTPLKKEYLME